MTPRRGPLACRPARWKLRLVAQPRRHAALDPRELPTRVTAVRARPPPRTCQRALNVPDEPLCVLLGDLACAQGGATLLRHPNHPGPGWPMFDQRAPPGHRFGVPHEFAPANAPQDQVEKVRMVRFRSRGQRLMPPTVGSGLPRIWVQQATEKSLGLSFAGACWPVEGPPRGCGHVRGRTRPASSSWRPRGLSGREALCGSRETVHQWRVERDLVPRGEAAQSRAPQDALDAMTCESGTYAPGP